MCPEEMDGERLEVGGRRQSPRHDLRGNGLVMQEIQSWVSREVLRIIWSLVLGSCTCNIYI